MVTVKTAAGLLACAVASLGGAGAGHLLTEDPSCAGVGAVHGQDKCKWIGWPSRRETDPALRSVGARALCRRPTDC